jgi:hypothetical protein
VLVLQQTAILELERKVLAIFSIFIVQDLVLMDLELPIQAQERVYPMDFTSILVVPEMHMFGSGRIRLLDLLPTTPKECEYLLMVLLA